MTSQFMEKFGIKVLGIFVLTEPMLNFIKASFLPEVARFVSPR